jgi:DNA-binding winged helix-turn-helix (wHTH) protein/TolB-like protein
MTWGALPEGAHLVTPRRTYQHHGIYVGDGKVVHYAGLHHGLRRRPVEEVTIDEFAKGHPIQLLTGTGSAFASHEVVERARSRMGENEWRLLTNNCEHFCEWCVRGEARSYQVEAVLALPRSRFHRIMRPMAFTPQQLQAGFRIGECLIEPRQNRIVRGDTQVHVESRVMDVLVCLAERAGEVVSRDTLNAQVWGNVVVTDQAVTNCISELRQHLGDDRSAHRVIETIPKRGYRLAAPVQLVEAQTRQPARARKPWLLASALVLLAAVLLGSALWWKQPAAPALKSIAVMRFENAAGDASLDYLALALPDEIATLLTKSRDLAVRPYEDVGGGDPLAAARARRVEHIVTGRYYLEDNERLTLAVEALFVPQERVIWRTRLTAPAGDLLTMREHIAEGVRKGLLPALGASAGPTGSMPAHDQAYQLYLHSLALPKQPKPTERAIEMLERAVELEPQFASGWAALGIRYYDHGTYGAGAEPARQQSLAALRKALQLDPDLIAAARQIVIMRVEAGDLAGAYADARRLLDHFGPSAQTHFALAYVYRYGGLLQEAQRHCELALDRDPNDPRLRSCAYSYLYAGELGRVMDFLMLDEGAYFVQWATVLYELRRNDRAAALHAVRQAADEPTRRLMEPCLEGTRGAALDGAVADFVAYWQRQGDPESPYAVAPILAYCERPQEALRFLERAVDGNFCSFPAFDLDPVWKSLRSNPEFQRIRSKGIACHERFRALVDAHDVQASNR